MLPEPLARLLPRVRAFIRAAAESPARPPHDADFAALALEIFAAQFECVPAYRHLAEHLGLAPGVATDWRDLPAAPAAAFKEFEFTAHPAGQRARVFRSSGTTRQIPSRVFHDADTLALYLESARAGFATHLIPDADRDPARRLRFLLLTPPEHEAPESSLACMGAAVAAAFGDGAPSWFGRADPDRGWTLDLPALSEALLAGAAEGTPVCLFGAAFSFVHLLDHLEATGVCLHLPDGSRTMETGGYKGRSRVLSPTELHAALTRLLGVPPTHLVTEYGMCELASQAYDRIAGETGPRVFRFPPWARARVISPETGEEVGEGEAGLLRVYDLANLHAVLAVQTEDLAVRRDGGFELLGRAARAEPRGCSLRAA